jgi:hypothetical protein
MRVGGIFWGRRPPSAGGGQPAGLAATKTSLSSFRRFLIANGIRRRSLTAGSRDGGGSSRRVEGDGGNVVTIPCEALRPFQDVELLMGANLYYLSLGPFFFVEVIPFSLCF